MPSTISLNINDKLSQLYSPQHKGSSEPRWQMITRSATDGASKTRWAYSFAGLSSLLPQISATDSGLAAAQQAWQATVKARGYLLGRRPLPTFSVQEVSQLLTCHKDVFEGAISPARASLAEKDTANVLSGLALVVVPMQPPFKGQQKLEELLAQFCREQLREEINKLRVFQSSTPPLVDKTKIHEAVDAFDLVRVAWVCLWAARLSSRLAHVDAGRSTCQWPPALLGSVACLSAVWGARSGPWLALIDAWGSIDDGGHAMRQLLDMVTVLRPRFCAQMLKVFMFALRWGNDAQERAALVYAGRRNCLYAMPSCDERLKNTAFMLGAMFDLNVNDKCQLFDAHGRVAGDSLERLAGYKAIRMLGAPRTTSLTAEAPSLDDNALEVLRELTHMPGACVLKVVNRAKTVLTELFDATSLKQVVTRLMALDDDPARRAVFDHVAYFADAHMSGADVLRLFDAFERQRQAAFVDVACLPLCGANITGGQRATIIDAMSWGTTPSAWQRLRGPLAGLGP